MKSPREGRWSVGSRLSEDLVKADASIVKGLDKGGMTGNCRSYWKVMSSEDLGGLISFGNLL